MTPTIALSIAMPTIVLLLCLCLMQACLLSLFHLRAGCSSVDLEGHKDKAATYIDLAG